MMKRILVAIGVGGAAALLGMGLMTDASADPMEVATLCHFGGEATQAERIANGDVGTAIVVSADIGNVNRMTGDNTLGHRGHGDCSLTLLDREHESPVREVDRRPGAQLLHLHREPQPRRLRRTRITPRAPT